VRMANLGAFAGTRGRAMPIFGVSFEMTGKGASKYQFYVEAIFLGSPMMQLSGQRVVLLGPTGREPLVGLRIGVEEVGARRQAVTPSVRASRPPGSVRVFRSRVKQDQSVAF
jgi:hypothetical protein